MRPRLANRILLNDELSRKVVEYSVDGLLVIDREGIVCFANPAAIAMFADKTQNLVGFHLGCPAIHEPVELILPRGTGTRYVEMRSTEIVWEGRTANLASLRDITTRKMAEERATLADHALRESDSHFRTLVEGAPDAIFVVSNSKFRYLNPPACRLFGAADSEEFLDKPVLNWVYPSCHQLIRSAFRQLEAEKKIVSAVEVTWLKADGTTVPAEISAVPLTYQGQNAAVVFARDITERKISADALKSSEQRYRAILEATPDGLIKLTPQGIIVFANTQAERMFGYARHALLGQDTASLFPEHYRALHVKRIKDYFANFQLQIMGSALETIGLRSDGTEFPIEARSSPIETEEGVLVLTAFRDVTDRKAAEHRSRQLEISVAEAEAANKAKSLFLSTMSHEIRTPMNAILGYSQLMLRDPELAADAKANLKVINRSGKHLLEIINNILDMAKIEAGLLQLTLQPVDLSRLVLDLEAMFRGQAEAKSLQFDINLHGEEGTHLITDGVKINQILINLLGNAIKFTERGRVSLKICLSGGPGNRLRLSAQIEDTGIGMTRQEQRDLFRPFVQGPSGQLLHVGGTGLGLTISQGIARLMGGDITTTSKPGRGSVFRLDIPVDRGVDPGLQTPSRVRNCVVGIKAGQQAPRILIADDISDNRGWLFKLLTSLGFSVLQVSNGAEALLAWKEWNPHLILMDMHMPVMGGLEATRRIRASPNGTKAIIIALTADALETNRQTVLASEMNDFISKPCAEGELLEIIRKHLGIVYDYDQDPSAGPRAAISVPEDPKLLADLIPEIRDAVLNGNKALLDTLIGAIEKRGDSQSAATLRVLADSYQYDRLIHWLESACIHD